MCRTLYKNIDTFANCKELRDLGASVLLNSYPMAKILSNVFPEFAWLPWKFTRAKVNFWSDPINWRPFMKQIAKELNVHEPYHWYRIKAKVCPFLCSFVDF